MMRLSSLSLRLQCAAAPPLLSSVAGLFESAETAIKFWALVREFTPEAEAKIRARNRPLDRASAFLEAFSARWFEVDTDIPDWGDETDDPYEQVIVGIPMQFMGIGYEQWHEIAEYGDRRPGFLLLCALCATAFDDSDFGARVALYDAIRPMMSDALVARIPEAGYPLDRIAQLTSGTRFAALADLSHILNQNADSDWLNISQEDFYETYGGQCDWDLEMVQSLAQSYQASVATWARVDELADWISKDAEDRFRQALNILEGAYAQLPLTLIEVFTQESEAS